MEDSLATVALETLRDLLIEEVRFLSGVSDQVKEVEVDLRTMHSLLIDADKWSDRYDPATLRNWVADLKDLAAKAENVLEKYAIEVTSKREGQNLKKKLKRFACIFSECLSVHRAGKETEVIRSRLTNLTERLKSMMNGGDEKSADGQQQQHLLRLTYAHDVEEYFVGMEKDIERVISLVKDRENRVISIYGMGGLGKTTLARKIYHHKEVQDCFEASSWVCVTQKFQAKTVLSEILKQFFAERKEEINGMELRELVDEIQRFQMQKRCLIVIDDIWEMDHWDILKPAFSMNCKVVITTRNEKIASRECLHKLDYLTEDQGWELLRKIAKVPETELSPLETLGRQMVQKCGRLPLSISVIGGILRQKQTFDEWETVTDNIDVYLKNGEGVGDNSRVKQVLDLSFDVLPYYLKSCFLYLGCFGEDEKIDTEKLYLLWMAEGLISSEEKGSNETLRDVAERYLSELAFRCMVQVEKDEIFIALNKFRSCRLHDLLRDLCTSKAEEQKFLKCIDFGKHTNYVPCAPSISRLSICFEGFGDDYFNEREQFEDLRSLLVLQKERSSVPTIGSKGSIINFDRSRFLRILKLEKCQFESQKLPDEIGKLVHLRYLSLFHSNVDELPLSICNMPYLQTLDLRSWLYMTLPNTICKIKRLRHLFIDSISVTGDNGSLLILDGLNELETLQGISSDNVRIADITKLTNLRKLSVDIKDMDSLSMIVDHMSNNQNRLHDVRLSVWFCDFSLAESSNVLSKMLMCHSLTSLEVHHCSGCNLPSYQPGMCKTLVKIVLVDSGIEGDGAMEIMGKYPKLKYLKLVGEEFVKTEMIYSATSFPQLKFLILRCLGNLEKWVVDKGAMPDLCYLDISDCLKLKMLPDGLGFIDKLRVLDIGLMPKKFKDRLRVVLMNGQQGQDYHKISHVQTISLGNDFGDDEEAAEISN